MMFRGKSESGSISDGAVAAPSLTLDVAQHCSIGGSVAPSTVAQPVAQIMLPGG